MKSAILKNNKIQIVGVDKPSIKNKKGAIIKVSGCGLCGSDIVKIDTSTKNSTPPILGHEVVGQIVDINLQITGNGAKDVFNIGDIVALGHHYPCFECKYCLHHNYSMCKTFKSSNIYPSGFSEYIYVDENHLKNTVFKKPENLTNMEFSFLEPLSCCIRAQKRAGLKENEDNKTYNVLVLGLGSIGILMAQAASYFKTNVFGFDINPCRMQNAKKYGIEFNDKIKYDIIYMTSGSYMALDTALNLIDLGGKIVVFSSIKNDFGYKNNDIYYKELTVLGSYSPSPSDLALSARLLETMAVNVKDILVNYELDNLALAVNDTKEGKILKAYINI